MFVHAQEWLSLHILRFVSGLVKLFDEEARGMRAGRDSSLCSAQLLNNQGIRYVTAATTARADMHPLQHVRRTPTPDSSQLALTQMLLTDAHYNLSIQL
jgi:hypothetical protein